RTTRRSQTRPDASPAPSATTSATTSARRPDGGRPRPSAPTAPPVDLPGRPRSGSTTTHGRPRAPASGTLAPPGRLHRAPVSARPIPAVAPRRAPGPTLGANDAHPNGAGRSSGGHRNAAREPRKVGSTPLGRPHRRDSSP